MRSRTFGKGQLALCIFRRGEFITDTRTGIQYQTFAQILNPLFNLLRILKISRRQGAMGDHFLEYAFRIDSRQPLDHIHDTLILPDQCFQSTARYRRCIRVYVE